MTLQDQAQTLRFFEGLGKPLSTREIEILAEYEGRTCGDCERLYGRPNSNPQEPALFACLWRDWPSPEDEACRDGFKSRE